MKKQETGSKVSTGICIAGYTKVAACPEIPSIKIPVNTGSEIIMLNCSQRQKLLTWWRSELITPVSAVAYMD